MVWAMTSVGARSRVIGLHVPFIYESARTWKAGHQAGRWVIFPTAAMALVFAGLAIRGTQEMVAIGWSVWLWGSYRVSILRRTSVSGTSYAIVHGRR